MEDHFSSMLLFSFFLELLFFSANTLQVLLFPRVLSFSSFSSLFSPFPFFAFSFSCFSLTLNTVDPWKTQVWTTWVYLNIIFFSIVNTRAIHNQWLVASEGITDMEGSFRFLTARGLHPNQVIKGQLYFYVMLFIAKVFTTCNVRLTPRLTFWIPAFALLTFFLTAY